MISASTLSDRRGLWAFILGVALVTSGVGLHLPMFLMGRMTHFRLYGMPMGNEMIVGMAAIIIGVGIAAYGLFSRRGIRDVGVDELIRASGVAKATFYRHFPSKVDLVLAF